MNEQDTTALLNDLFDGSATFSRALTRRAWLTERGMPAGPDQHHEPLECVGDAWLGAVVTSELFRRFPQADALTLTRARSALVCESTLAEVWAAHDLDRCVRAGAGEVLQGQHMTAKSRASHLEAVVGAAYEQHGLPGVQRLVLHLLEGRWPATLTDAAVEVENAKGRLGELVAQVVRTPGKEPSYTSERDPETPDHKPLFRATVAVPWGEFTGEWRSSSKAAEQSAAAAALAGQP
jgi:ribonuclease-3